MEAFSMEKNAIGPGLFRHVPNDDADLEKYQDTEEDEFDETYSDSEGADSVHSQEDDLAIVLVGPTGCGKSTFVSRLCSERNDIEIGQSLNSCTTEVDVYVYQQSKSQRVFLLDTPGFDSSSMSQLEVFEKIIRSLCEAYEAQLHKLAGFIYFHRITDTRMGGASLASLRIFEKLVGKGNYGNVAIVTTMWDMLHNEKLKAAGVQRERDLKSKSGQFRRLTRFGARMFRLGDSLESASMAVDHLVRQEERVVVDIQKKIVDDKKLLMETGEGRFMAKQLHATTMSKVRSKTIGPTDIVISITGVSGCGKSTFINYFSDDKVQVGHGLESCTKIMKAIPCTLPGDKKIFLIDTPGLDDTSRTDSGALREIAAWLSTAYEKHIQLTGIIYLHRITDARTVGSGINHLQMFRKLCGDDGLARVVLATTMWDSVEAATGLAREQELTQGTTFWKSMIDKGSRVFRLDSDRTSALRIVQYLIDRKNPATLEAQQESVQESVEANLSKELEERKSRMRDLEMRLDRSEMERLQFLNRLEKIEQAHNAKADTSSPRYKSKPGISDAYGSPRGYELLGKEAYRDGKEQATRKTTHRSTRPSTSDEGKSESRLNMGNMITKDDEAHRTSERMPSRPVHDALAPFGENRVRKRGPEIPPVPPPMI